MRTSWTLAAGCLLALVAGAQDPTQDVWTDRLHFTAKLESIRSAEVGGTARVVRSVARTDYVHLLAPGRRRIVLQAVATERSVDGRAVEASALSRNEAVWLEPDGSRHSTARTGAPERLRTRMDAFDEPWSECELDADGREAARRVLVAPEVAEQFTDQQLAPSRFFHVPFPAGDDVWGVARTLVADASLAGTLQYHKRATPTEAGLVEVSVSGELAGVGAGPGVGVFTVSGRQLYDPVFREWVRGRVTLESGESKFELTLELANAPLVAGGEFAVGAETVRWRRPAHWQVKDGAAMRVVDLVVGNDVSCYVVVLPGDGGGIAANFARWRSQLGLEPAGGGAAELGETLEVLGRPASWLRLDGPPAADGTPARRLLGLACQLEDATLFVKLSGPAAIVRAAEADFEAFCTVLQFDREHDEAPADDREEATAVPTLEEARPILIEASERYDQGQHERVLELLDPLIATGFELRGAFLLRSSSRGRLGDTPGALADLDRVIELSPDFGRGFAERAYHRYQSGDAERALLDYDRALELGETTPPVYGERGDTLKDLGRFADAMDSYRLAIEKAPNWAQPWAGSADAAARLGDPATAAAQYQRALVLAPQITGWLPSLARAVFDAGESERAMRIVSRIELDDVSASRLDFLGVVALEASDLERARALLHQAADRSEGNDSARSRLSLASAELAEGNDSRAIEVLTKARGSADASLRPWVDLMQWCALARRDGLDVAARWLQQQVAENVPAPDTLHAELLLLCLAGEGLGDVERTTLGRGDEACAPLFFAAWRHLVRGEDARAERLLRHCVNTGAWHWTQWRLAMVLLEARLGATAWTPDLGWRCEVVDEARGRPQHAVVRELTPGGAAERQGIRVGDWITGVRQRPFTREEWQRACDVPRVGGLLSFERTREGSIEERTLFAGVASRD